MRGKYIIIEGGEYTGKSTQAALLAESIGAVQVREPGGTEIGERVRDLLLDKDLNKTPLTQSLLFAAQRSELADTIIRPSLKKGRDVVSDRSWISTAAYQSVDGVPISTIESINSIALNELIRPDLCIILDGDPNVLIDRAIKAGKTADFYESKELLFHENLRENYQKVGQLVGAVTLSAVGDIEDISSEIRRTVTEKLGI